MFVIGNLLGALAGVLDIVLTLLLAVVLVNAVLSWVRPDPNNPIVLLLERISDLVCNPIRRLIPTTVGGIDFAPFVAMLALYFIQRFLVDSLRDLAARMG
jgi:YggT family protein